MNYTKTIREYCKTTPWKIFDVSYEINERFKMVPYKTLLKVLNRLEEEGLVETIAKGIYAIKAGKPVEDPVLAHYAADGRGIMVGYAMYNKYEVTDYKQDPIVIYTNATLNDTKRIGDKYYLVRFPMFFSDKAKYLVSALELLEKGPHIIDGSPLMRVKVIAELLQFGYNDFVLKDILKAHHYQYHTILALDSVLLNLDIENNARDIYEKCYNA